MPCSNRGATNNSRVPVPLELAWRLPWQVQECQDQGGGGWAGLQLALGQGPASSGPWQLTRRPCVSTARASPQGTGAPQAGVTAEHRDSRALPRGMAREGRVEQGVGGGCSWSKISWSVHLGLIFHLPSFLPPSYLPPRSSYPLSPPPTPHPLPPSKAFCQCLFLCESPLGQLSPGGWLVKQERLSLFYFHKFS